MRATGSVGAKEEMLQVIAEWLGVQTLSEVERRDNLPARPRPRDAGIEHGRQVVASTDGSRSSAAGARHFLASCSRDSCQALDIGSHRWLQET